MDFHFFMPMIPPTITQQEHKVTIRNGRPIFYEPAELKAARSELLDSVARFAPEKELTGPIRLTTKWIWPSGSEDFHWKTTKPDTDNLIKMLKDCMTRAGFWRDDAQVASEITEKAEGPHPGIYVEIEELTL